MESAHPLTVRTCRLHDDHAWQYCYVYQDPIFGLGWFVMKHSSQEQDNATHLGTMEFYMIANQQLSSPLKEIGPVLLLRTVFPASDEVSVDPTMVEWKRNLDSLPLSGLTS